MSKGKARITEEQRSIYKKARKQGWEVVPTRSGHNRWISPQGKSVFHSSSTSDRKSVLNLVRDLKHRGFQV